MHVQIVITNFLVCQEMTIRRNRQVVLFQETIQLLDTSITWILHQVFHEQCHRFNGEPFLQHLNHSSCKGTVKLFAFPEQSFTLNSYITLTIVENNFLWFNNVFDCFPITCFNSIKNLLIGHMCFRNCVTGVTDHDYNV